MPVFFSVTAVQLPPLQRSYVHDVFSANSIQLSGLVSSSGQTQTNHHHRTTNESSHNPTAGRRISSIVEESTASGTQNFRDRIQSLQISVPGLVIYLRFIHSSILTYPISLCPFFSSQFLGYTLCAGLCLVVGRFIMIYYE